MATVSPGFKLIVMTDAIEEEIEEGMVTGAEHGVLEEYAGVITEVRRTSHARTEAGGPSTPRPQSPAALADQARVRARARSSSVSTRISPATGRAWS